MLLRAYMAPDLYGIARGKKLVHDSFWFQVKHRQLDYAVGHNATRAVPVIAAGMHSVCVYAPLHASPPSLEIQGTANQDRAGVRGV